MEHTRSGTTTALSFNLFIEKWTFCAANRACRSRRHKRWSRSRKSFKTSGPLKASFETLRDQILHNFHLRFQSQPNSQQPHSRMNDWIRCRLQKRFSWYRRVDWCTMDILAGSIPRNLLMYEWRCIGVLLGSSRSGKRWLWHRCRRMRIHWNLLCVKVIFWFLLL